VTQDTARASAPLYRAIVEYDGTDFVGFQWQAVGRTVQGEIERTLARLTQQTVRVVGAGRTDTGVHALGQVIAFRVHWKRSPHDLERGLNALLPPDIAIRALAEAPEGFHPRFSAVERWYRYQIGRWPGHSPLRARYAWELDRPLDVRAMNEAAAVLIGSHDFASFGQPTQGEAGGSTIRHLTQAEWREEPPYLVFDVRANGFLRNMVRTLVGTLVRVGTGEISPADFAALLARRERAQAAPPAPPQGLILMAVTYPDEPPSVPLSAFPRFLPQTS
jgi:tRNA pseudouridine38-40 synthase